MKLFRFCRELRTGMALLDEQHRQYGRFVNKLLRIGNRRESVSQDAQLKAFAFLHAYAREHLQTEEALMATYAYPRRDEHLERHRVFSSWIETTRTQVLAGPLTPDQLMQVDFMLVDWFEKHIKEEDRQLTDHLQQVARDRGDCYLLGLIGGLFGHSLTQAPQAARTRH